MLEVGIGISGHPSKPLHDVSPETADRIVTLCAEEICPVVAGPVRRLRWPIADRAAGDLAAFRTARDQVKARIEVLGTRPRHARGTEGDRGPRQAARA